jgi:hypothetical protein
MTDQVISAHTVKMRFPEFEPVQSTRIEFAIEEAALQVDWTWGIYEALGMMWLSAHILMMEISRAGSSTGQQIASESFPGVVSVTYTTAPPLTDVEVDDLSQTFYGVRFKALRDAAVGSVAIV